ncbi:MAG: beta-ketoacyl-[acyl-carrier-protein] synthase II, partial [candidate division Zixibacteria bacterium]|nr:beta-ketoacyl-[acyl-carrier-protein] synthase II [candidate division Zixibacteria bacterium]
PTINLDNPDPECDLDYVPNVKKNHNINYALTNSFGFGGHNVSLLIGKSNDSM